MDSRVEALRAEFEALQDRAADTVAAIVSERLAALEARYPRHTFRLFDGMGSTFFIVSPPFLGERNLSPYYWPTVHGPPWCREIVERFYSELESILELCVILEDEFNANVGDVPSPSEELKINP